MSSKADLFKFVEEDVESKRYLKNPFKEEYIEVLHMPLEESIAKMRSKEEGLFQLRDGMIFTRNLNLKETSRAGCKI